MAGCKEVGLYPLKAVGESPNYYIVVDQGAFYANSTEM